MIQLLKLPLAFIYFYFECKKSPVNGDRIKWTDLYSFLIKVRWFSIISGSKRDVSLRFLKYNLCASDYISLENLFHEIFVSGEYHYAENEFKPEVIFDCGANIGMTTLFFKILYPDVKIRAFEPNPKAFYYLNKNITSNNLLNVFPYQVALSDTNGEMELFFDNENLVTGSLNNGREIFNHSVTVKTAKLSDYIAQEARIDILKMDVEGAEHIILAELAKTGLLQKPSRYLIEYHNFEIVDTYIEFLSLFAKLSYCVQFGSNINRKKNYQDVLIYLN